MPNVDVANTGLLPAGGGAWHDRGLEPVRAGRTEASGRARARRRLVTLALLGGDLAVVLIAGGSALWLAGGASAVSAGVLAVALLGWCAVQLVVLALFGLYEPIEAEPIERLRRRTLASTWACGVAMLLWAVRTGAPELAIALAALLSVPLGHYAEGWVRAALVRRNLWGAATIVYGDGAADFARMLAGRPELGLRPIGLLVDPEGVVEPFRAVTGLPATTEMASDPLEAAEIVISTPGETRPERFAWLTRHPFRQVLVAHHAPEVETVRLQTRCLGPVVGLVVRRAIFLPHNLRLKRAIDLAITIPALIVMAPLIAGLALWVRVADPGPAFYVQPRVGKNGRTIRVYKLRSMYRDAEARLAEHLAKYEAARREWERFYKLKSDPRVLPGIGAFIRRTSLDELPQLLNVLRGDISVIGPRPFPAYHAERFDPAFQALRSSVPPGLTGLWQISSRSDGDLAVQQQQDSFYIRNWSIWVDLYILLETVPAVLTAKGAR